MNQFAYANRAGPRDIFGYEPIRSPVVQTLGNIGMDADLIVDILGIKDGEIKALVVAQAPKKAKVDIKLALAQWAKSHAYKRRRMSKTYASACMQNLQNFVEREPQHAKQHDVYVAHRIDHEIHRALSLWLRIDRFVAVAETREGTFTALLDPHYEDGDRLLAILLHHAFAVELGLPERGAAVDLWEKAVALTIERELPHWIAPGEYLAVHLMSHHWELITRDIRPFIAPMWPKGSSDRIRTVLRSRDWEGDEAREVDYACDSTAVFRESYEAMQEYHQAKRSTDPAAFAAAKKRAEAAQKRESELHKISGNHEIRAAARQRIGDWLRDAAPELIELVRPCGDPLGART